MDNLYIGMKGHVVCINSKTGKERWRTKLKSADLTNIYLEGDKVFVYANGHLFAVDAKTGKELWENDLKGLGYGSCIIAGQQTAGAVASQLAQQGNAAAVAASAGVVATSAGS